MRDFIGHAILGVATTEAETRSPMSERPPIDVEATAANVLNGVMVSILCLAGAGISLGFAAERVGDLGQVSSDRGLIAWGTLANGLVTTVVLAQFAWTTIKGLSRLPVRKIAPDPLVVEPLSREELIRQAPWTGRGSVGRAKPFTLASVAQAIGLIALAVIIWRLPAPYREWAWMALMITLVFVRLVELAWSRRRQARPNRS